MSNRKSKLTVLQRVKLTPSEYLARERQAECRSEYLFGVLIPMPGSCRAHNLIRGNLCRELSKHLKDRPDEVYAADMRVQIPIGIYTYPDVVVVCGTPKFEDDQADTLRNPTVLIEVLSESTADFDRGSKFKHYRLILSLREYVLVDQAEAQIEHWMREEDGRWVLTEITGIENALSLDSIGCQIPLSEVYRKISVPPAGQTGIA